MKTFLAVLLAFGAGVAVAVFIQKSQKTPTGQSPRPPRPPQPSPPPQSSRPSSLQEKFARVRSSMPVTAQAQDTPSPASAQAEHPGAKWFRQQIMAFADDLLAYYVSQYALEQNLSAVKTMELYQKYGRKPFEPSLQEYEAGFREQGLNLTGLAEREWCDGNLR